MHAHLLADPAAIEFDSELLRRYDKAGPRYTSYPTADRFVEEFDAARYGEEARSAVHGARPLSLYVHLPFCDTICFYCACNKIGSKNRGDADIYLDYLEKEIALQRPLFGHAPQVSQLHLGGGSPTFLRDDQLQRLMAMLTAAFPLRDGAECSVEIDPRQLGEGTLAVLAECGFTRMSIGVQDVNEAVQQAVNRIQPVNMTSETLAEGRRLGFRSINIDLIYGLPHQSLSTMQATLEQVKRWRPDRIALYSYAHLPERFKPQRRIDTQALPAAAEKLAMLKLATESLLDAGYIYIGMDHFALPEDELAVALRSGRLHRNFQGYSTHADCDLLALGVSSIGKVGNSYVQNHRALEDYYDALDQGQLAVARGLTLTADDLLRRAVIQALLCHAELSIEAFETGWLIDFKRYFAYELEALNALADDGLVVVDDEMIQITPRGRLLARAVAMVFDRYLREAQQGGRFSRLI
ncbi:oxygen-independent coproporphyrinogen III oxidase [Chitinimonas sp.]|uniref:oxygen-independent coproporphyrinogen III oxidase n=1 Tax=Chitinimonas sp. TaxID=1934313 RepID=UPI0035ADD82F